MGRLVQKIKRQLCIDLEKMKENCVCECKEGLFFPPLPPVNLLQSSRLLLVPLDKLLLSFM